MRASCVLISALLVVPHLADAATGLKLSRDGKSDYRIVVSAKAVPSEQYAAQELQKYLEKISGARLPIVTDDSKAAAHEIVLGRNSHAAKLGRDATQTKVGPDGFVWQTDGRRLLIAGGYPRGTLNGVYSFLEEQLGVRWFTPELEVVPATNQILVSSLRESRVPVLEYREVYWTEMMRDADFASRHRLNGNSYPLKEKHGGRFAVYFPFVHSMELLIPPELFASHPEYFPLIGGDRRNGYVQRCLANPEVVKLAKANVRKWIHDHPEARIISVSQNDTGNWCQCEQCKSLDDAEGSPAASLLRFVNAIAEDIERDFPEVRIDTLAYQYTRKPPKTIRPRKNVIIRLCSIECCFAHPLASCASPQNTRFREDITNWEPVAPLLYVWDYTPNFAHYQQPFPNWDALQLNVQFFSGHGVKGLFEQGNYSSGGLGEMGPLRAYVLAKLLWDPNTNVERHKREFMSAYFGAAAPKIAEYLDLVEAQVRDGKTHAHIFDSPKAGYLNAEFTAKADAILEQAEAAAQDVPTKSRVQVARLPVWYVMLSNDRVPGEQKGALRERFLQIARAAKITNISESRGLEDWATAQK